MLTKKKEIDEVRKIISEGGNFQNYIKEIDLLDDAEDVAQNISPADKKQTANPNPFGLPLPPVKSTIQSQSPNNPAKPTQNVNTQGDFDLLGMDSGPKPFITPEPILGMS